MRVPLSWLKEMVDIPAGVTPEALAERLTVAGLEVGKIHYIGVPQSEELYGVPPSDHLVWDTEKIILGAITEVKQHPDADKLVLAMVEYGGDEQEQVVTGAPNLFDYLGQGELNPPLLTPFALEGAEVIDGHGDGTARMILKERKLRGIPNRCMVCSEMELGISEEHEGILLLDYNTYKQHTPGTPFVEVLGDVVLELELTPNLARCFSILGVAREVAALYGTEVREPDYSLPETSGGSVEEAVTLEIHEAELNPRFTMALIRDVTIKESPEWMQRRLKLVGQRPINNIVDVTNYVMFEIGQPTHAFDYDILKARAGGDKPLVYTRLAKDGEELTTLDGKHHKLLPEHIMVCDGQGILSFGGAMGGLESEVQDPNTENGGTGTQTVLYEAAAWNLIALRKTVSTTKMTSEASSRFSRGVHPAMALKGLMRGAKLMVEVADATLAPGILDVYPKPAEVVKVDLPYSEIERLLGFEIPLNEVEAILKGLQFEVETKDDVLYITVPDHRLDISTDVIIGRADIIEEIARVYGYNNIPITTIADALPPQIGNTDLDREELVRDLLVQAGLQEVINYRFTTPAQEAKLTPSGAQSSWPQRDYVEILNPISVDRTVFRQTLLAGLLENAEVNMYQQASQKLFEVGNVYYRVEGGLPEEPRRLGLLLIGQREIESWMGGANTDSVDFYDLKGVVESLLRGLSIETRSVTYKPTDHNSFHPGRVAEVLIGKTSLGYIGEVHPLVREAYGLGLDLNAPVIAAELDLDALIHISPPRVVVEEIPTQPASYRDLAVVVPASTLASEVEDVIWRSGGNLLQKVELFDVYTGGSVEEGHRSLAYSLVFQSTTETLTDKAVNKVQKKIVKAIEKAGGKLRA